MKNNLKLAFVACVAVLFGAAGSWFVDEFRSGWNLPIPVPAPEKPWPVRDEDAPASEAAPIPVRAFPALVEPGPVVLTAELGDEENPAARAAQVLRQAAVLFGGDPENLQFRLKDTWESDRGFDTSATFLTREGASPELASLEYFHGKTEPGSDNLELLEYHVRRPDSFDLLKARRRTSDGEWEEIPYSVYTKLRYQK